jgi:hypothetical protein
MATKTLDELAKQVVDTQAGLMSVDDLRVLFDGEPTPAPEPQTPVEPVVVAPEPVSPVVPVEPTPTIPTPVPPTIPTPKPGQKSIEEYELELQTARQEKEDAIKLYNSMVIPSQPEPVQPVAPVEEDDDTAFFEKPTEASRKVARKEVATALMAYHQSLLEAQKRVNFVNEFKSSHIADFDTYREDMAFVLKARPDLDKNYTSLPTVYEMAKQRYKMRIGKMRADLGIIEQPVVAPAPVTPPPALDEAALIEKVKNILAEEIRKRKSASGIQGGSNPVSPATRTEPTVRVAPLTPEDAIFEEMLKSGPRRFELGDGGIK